jgi:hypothetical protein
MNQLYNIGVRGFLTTVDVGTLTNQQIDWVNDNIRAALINTTQGVTAERYTFSVTHDALDDIPEDSVIADVAITGRSSDSQGFALAANILFPTVSSPGGASTTLHADALVLYRNAPAAGSSAPSVGQKPDCILLAYIDTAINLGVIPNGQNITVIINNGDGKVFRL